MLELTLSNDCVADCSHVGECLPDVIEWVRHPSVRDQLDAMHPDDIRRALKPYGAWDDDELADDDANRWRLLWLAAGQLRENWRENEPGNTAYFDFC